MKKTDVGKVRERHKVSNIWHYSYLLHQQFGHDIKCKVVEFLWLSNIDLLRRVFKSFDLNCVIESTFFYYFFPLCVCLCVKSHLEWMLCDSLVHRVPNVSGL